MLCMWSYQCPRIEVGSAFILIVILIFFFCLGHLCVENESIYKKKLIDQVAASIVGGTDASSLARKGVCKEQLFQIISVTTQVTISRRVHRCRLSLRDRRAARGREEESGGLRPLA